MEEITDTAGASAYHGEAPWAVRNFKALAGLFMAYFALRLIFLAVNISPVVPPDEVTHCGICQIYSATPFLPANSPQTFSLGLVNHIPWLYYFLMGKLLDLDLLGIPDLVFLRLVNIPLAFGLVYYAWRTLCLLTKDRLCQLLLIVAMTNTMMLTFLSAFVSYDNLTNLLAAMATYYLLAFLKTRSKRSLFISHVCQLAGCLTKVSFLPLALILNLVLLAAEWRRLPHLPGALSRLALRSRRLTVVAGAALLAGLALNAQLYVENLLDYGTLWPEATQVLPLRDALKNRIAARDYIFHEFHDGHMNKIEALQMASLIQHGGDRADAMAMIENYDRVKRNGFHPYTLTSYWPVWVKGMAEGTFGIIGQFVLPGSWPWIAPVAFLAALALLAFLAQWRPVERHRLATVLFAVSALYASFLMYQVNYKTYLETASINLALQGRYIFPVIAPIYVLASFYLMNLFKNRRARVGAWGVAVVIFLLCDFPMFIARINPGWTDWPN